MKQAKYLIIFLLLAVLLIFAHSYGHLSCSSRLREDNRATINGEIIVLQRAASLTDREKGLGGLDCMGNNEGMLFVFDRPDYYQFWMKDMRFPLDIIWLNSDRQVVTVKRNVAPSSYPQTFVSNQPAQYVLEIKAGQADNLKISQKQLIDF